jgi:hypothetical protein
MITKLLKYIENYDVEEYIDVEDEIYYINNININNIILIKNPKNIYLLPKYIRGIIDNEGNLFVFCYENEYKKHKVANVITHSNMLQKKEFEKITGIKSNVSDWYKNMPNNYLCVQRYNDSNEFLLSESYEIIKPNNDDYTIENEYNFLLLSKIFIDKAKQKNNEIYFVNKQIDNSYWNIRENLIQKFENYTVEEFDKIENDEIIRSEIDDIIIIKNPKNVYWLPKYIRGIATKTGDIYVWCYKKEYKTNKYFSTIYEVLHQDILPEICEIIDIKFNGNWWHKGSKDYIAIQRYNDSNEFFLSESYVEEIIILNNTIEIINNTNKTQKEIYIVKKQIM